MTATTSQGTASASKLPIPVLADPAPRVHAREVVTPVDRDGRLADRSVLTFLGWTAGMEIALTVWPGPIVIARPGAGVRVDRRGHLHLPMVVRQASGIVRGDRVLLAARDGAGELLIIPGRVITGMIEAHRHASSKAPAP